MIGHLDGLTAPHPQWRGNASMTHAGFQAAAFQLARRRRASRSSPCSRPERKNPITFDSYAELRDTFRALATAERRQGGRVRLQRRQFLLRRRRARHHRPAARARHEGPARLHPHDRRSRQGDARLPAADHRGGRRHLRRRRRDDRAVLRHAARHAGGQDRVSVHARRARRLRHGRLRDAAARHRAGPRGRAAVHRPHDERGRGRALGLLQSAGRGRRARSARRSRWRTASPTARPSRT